MYATNEIKGTSMSSDPTYSSSPLNLTQAAQEFATEVSGTAERKKKTIPSPVGLQLFLLYVRAQGYVPAHQVAGPITVQTIFGDARLAIAGQNYDLPQGSVVCLSAGVPHDVFVSTDTVLLVTHVLHG
jgi:quercetin dioxygenase-like cupin family protein